MKKQFKEIKEKRDLGTKVFEAEDGSGYIEISSAPVHYLKDGSYEPIDTKLKKTDAGYTGDIGDYKVMLSENDESVTCSYKDKSVTWKLKNEARAAGLAELLNSSSSLKYAGKDEDLDYELDPGHLKEKIVIKRPLEEYKYEFDLSSEGLLPVPDGNGGFSFMDEDGNEVFSIPKGCMYDSAGRRSDDVVFSLDKKDKGYLFLITADKAWINSEDTAFPVVIDPEMYFNETLNTGVTYINTKPGKDGPYAELGIINGNPVEHSSLISLNLSALPDEAIITGATLELKQLSGNAPGFYWELEDTYTGSGYDSEVACEATDTAGHIFQTDVYAPVFKAIETGRNSCTLRLSAYTREEMREDIINAFSIEDPCDCEILDLLGDEVPGHIEFDGLTAKLRVNYVSEATYRDHRPEVSLITGQTVDLDTGEMSFSVNDVSTGSPAFPVSISHYYSSLSGWRMNLEQNVSILPYGSTFEAKYTDGCGREHYFANIDGRLTDAGGLDMIFSYVQNGYRVTDKNGYSIEFNMSGKPIKLLDKNGNHANISRDNLGRINLLTDSFGRTITLTYDQNTGKLKRVYDPSGRYIGITYSGNNITSITYPDGVQVSFWYSNGKMSRIVNPDGTQSKFSYTGDKLSKAESLPSGSETCNDFTRVIYNTNKTVEVRNRTGVGRVYVLDENGRIKCEYDKKYSTAGQADHGIPTGTVLFNYTGTRRTFSSSLAGTGENLIVNGDFSGEQEAPWVFVGDRSSSDGITCCSGTYAIRGIPNKDKYIRQTIDGEDVLVPYGNTLMLSAWAKASSGSGTKLRMTAEVWYTNGTHCDFEAEFDKNFTDWQYAAVPVKIDRTLMIDCINVFLEYSRGSGICLFDNVRLVCAPAMEAEYETEVDEYVNIFGVQQTIYERVTSSNGIYTTVTEKDYNKDVIRQTVTDSDGHSFTSVYEYDSCRRLIRTQNEKKVITEYTYNNVGMPTSAKIFSCGSFNPSVVPEPEEYFLQTTEYDQTGEFAVGIGDSRSDNIQKQNTYDTTKGMLTGVTFANGQSVSYTYNSSNDLLTGVSSMIGNDEYSVLFGYDNKRRLTSITHNGFQYGFTYDSSGRQEKFYIAGSLYCENSYELSDTTKMTTEYATGESVSFETDRNGMPIKSIYTDSTDTDTLLSEGQYDDLGNTIALSDHMSGIEYTYEYGTYGNVICEKRDGDPYKSSEYDSDCRLTRTETEAGAYIPSYDSKNGTIYPGNMITGISLEDKYTENISRDVYGRIGSEEITPDSASVPLVKNEISYLSVEENEGTRLTCFPASFRTIINGTETDLLSYTYDNNGNITGVYRSGNLIIRYVYDGAERLVREDNSILNATYTYSYDVAGNILEKKRYAYTTSALVTPLETKTYSYSSSGWKDRLVSYDGSNIIYDAVGNPTTYRGNSLTWGKVRLLESFGQNTFSYNASGLRIRKNSTEYTLDDAMIVKEERTGTVIKYHYGASGIIGFNYNGTDYYYRKNLVGDILGIYGSDGTKYAEYAYDAWGNHSVTVDINGIGTLNPFRYRGYYYDVETGLYYLQSRYYDPVTGRFINADRLLTSKAGFSAYNLYAYCRNNPVMYLDTQGTKEEAVLTTRDLAVFLLIGGTCVSILFITEAEKHKKVIIPPLVDHSLIKKSETLEIPEEYSEKLQQLVRPLTIAIAKVINKFYNHSTEDHHIVARIARDAEESREILSSLDIGINDSPNIVTLSTGFHKVLHTKLYYGIVNEIVKTAYAKGIEAGCAKISVENALKAIGKFLQFADTHMDDLRSSFYQIIM